MRTTFGRGSAARVDSESARHGAAQASATAPSATIPRIRLPPGPRGPRLPGTAAREADMHVGLGIIFQGTDHRRSDLEVYQNDLRFGSMAESLGFQSIWGVEHHFTDYTMCPDVLQLLTYFAGRTENALLGSMVVVLPWHDPLRVAEQVSMLDNLSGGRVVLGLGRGL